MHTERYAVDRIEDRVAVLISDADDKILNLDLDEYSLEQSDVVDITFDEDKITSLVKLPEEKQARLDRIKRKLELLMKKKRN